MCECVPCHMALFRSSSSFVCNIHLAMHDFAVVVVGCPFLSVTFKLIILFIDSHSHARPKNFTIKCNMSSEFFLSKFYAHQKIFENFFFSLSSCVRLYTVNFVHENKLLFFLLSSFSILPFQQRRYYWVLRSAFNLHGTNLESRADFLLAVRNMLKKYLRVESSQWLQ